MGVGTGLPQSNSSAIHWLRKAAVQGHVVSMKRLAYCYRYGLGTEKDLERAFRWSLKAAKQGDSHAMSRVAHCYYMGQGTRISHSRCSAWQEALYDFEQWGLFPNPLEKAAESGKSDPAKPKYPQNLNPNLQGRKSEPHILMQKRKPQTDNSSTISTKLNALSREPYITNATCNLSGINNQD